MHDFFMSNLKDATNDGRFPLSKDLSDDSKEEIFFDRENAPVFRNVHRRDVFSGTSKEGFLFDPNVMSNLKDETNDGRFPLSKHVLKKEEWSQDDDDLLRRKV